MTMVPPTVIPYITVTDARRSFDFELHRRYNNGHPSSPWRRAAIVPLWVVELILLAFNAVITGMIIGITESGGESGKNQLQPWMVISMVSATIALIITCGEVMEFAYYTLTPKAYLWSGVSKLVIGMVPIQYQISVTRTSWMNQPLDKIYIVVAFGFSGVTYLFYIISLGYAVYVFKQTRNHVKRLYDSYSVDSEGQG